MKQYFVEFRRTSFINVWVDAETEEQAEALAWKELEGDHYVEDASFELETIEVQS